MKIRHNKKRNTAFVYEALVREKTVAILRNDLEKQQKIVDLLKKHFGPQSPLKRDLDCYRSLYENQGFDEKTSEKILKESKLQRHMIDSDLLFTAQTELIHDVNKTLDPSVFANFVPNYKRLATIDSIFSQSTSPKDRIILENEILREMQQDEPDAQVDDPIDNVVYRAFVKKFNTKYDDELLPEQKELLSHYISSFADNALGLKTFLNEEIARLKSALRDAPKNEHISADPAMIEKSKEVLGRLDSFAKEGVNENLLATILKTQKLVKEIDTDGDSN